MQRWRRDGFRDDGIEAVFIQTAEILGWNDEGDVAVKRFPLILQLKLTPTAGSLSRSQDHDSARGVWPILHPLVETSC
jgi:hypothetical protein